MIAPEGFAITFPKAYASNLSKPVATSFFSFFSSAGASDVPGAKTLTFAISKELSTAQSRASDIPKPIFKFPPPAPSS